MSEPLDTEMPVIEETADYQWQVRLPDGKFLDNENNLGTFKFYSSASAETAAETAQRDQSDSSQRVRA